MRSDRASGEALVRAFHAARPGATRSAFVRAGSYELLHARVRGASSVLDLACGNAPMEGAIGLDLSREELALGGATRVQARAQELPFHDASFDACVCHLAFMLFAEVERVVGELARVLVRGGRFVALVGGGPVEDFARERTDAFHRFLAIARPHLRGTLPGDRRASTIEGWHELFAGWSGEPTFERVELDLGGAFDDVWTFLGASYQLDPGKAGEVRDALRAEMGERCECRVVAWIASVVR